MKCYPGPSPTDTFIILRNILKSRVGIGGDILKKFSACFLMAVRIGERFLNHYGWWYSYDTRGLSNDSKCLVLDNLIFCRLVFASKPQICAHQRSMGRLTQQYFIFHSHFITIQTVSKALFSIIKLLYTIFHIFASRESAVQKTPRYKTTRLKLTNEPSRYNGGGIK